MTVLPAPRPRRRTWFDPRVAVGVLLVVASVAGVVTLVAGQSRTATVWTARDPLLAGDRVTADDLQPTQMRLGDAATRYLSGSLPKQGYVATRTVEAGEIVPLSALGSVSGVDVASMVVTLSTALAAEAQPGATVDLWAAEKTAPTATTYGPPVVLVSGATVVRLVQQQGILQSADGTVVELQVPRDRVAAVLEAVADDSRISAVTVGRPAR